LGPRHAVRRFLTLVKVAVRKFLVLVRTGIVRWWWV
jgi:hypothetical protein